MFLCLSTGGAKPTLQDYNGEGTCYMCKKGGREKTHHRAEDEQMGSRATVFCLNPNSPLPHRLGFLCLLGKNKSKMQLCRVIGNHQPHTDVTCSCSIWQAVAFTPTTPAMVFMIFFYEWIRWTTRLLWLWVIPPWVKPQSSVCLFGPHNCPASNLRVSLVTSVWAGWEGGGQS